ncbi:MAG: hypothetical protein LBG59_09030 [Candidatus Peribacteria bacterium]|nr:hypothetical protein [Candidatus Peribacteria bacterium]
MRNEITSILFLILLPPSHSIQLIEKFTRLQKLLLTGNERLFLLKGGYPMMGREKFQRLDFIEIHEQNVI